MNNIDIVANEIVKHLNRFPIGRLALCSSWHQKHLDYTARSFKCRLHVRFIAKKWLNAARVRKHAIKYESSDGFVTYIPLLECPKSLRRALTVRKNYTHISYTATVMEGVLDDNVVEMLIIDTDGFPEMATVAVINRDSAIISEFRHKVIPGFPIFHTFVYGPLDVRQLGICVKIFSDIVLLNSSVAKILRDGILPNSTVYWTKMSCYGRDTGGSRPQRAPYYGPYRVNQYTMTPTKDSARFIK